MKIINNHVVIDPSNKFTLCDVEIPYHHEIFHTSQYYGLCKNCIKEHKHRTTCGRKILSHMFAGWTLSLKNSKINFVNTSTNSTKILHYPIIDFLVNEGYLQETKLFPFKETKTIFYSLTAKATNYLKDFYNHA